jgi:hypothetical protein
MIRIRRTPRATLVAALALLGLYLLALGPALWVICQNPPRWVVGTIYSFYEPLDLLARRSRTVNDCLVAYAGIWLPADANRRATPTPPIRLLQVFLGSGMACWFIWNVVGWFAPKRHPAAESSDRKKACP